MLQVVTERDEARANRDRLAHELAAARAEVAQLRRTRPDRNHARRLEAAESARSRVEALAERAARKGYDLDPHEVLDALATPTTPSAGVPEGEPAADGSAVAAPQTAPLPTPAEGPLTTPTTTEVHS